MNFIIEFSLCFQGAYLLRINSNGEKGQADPWAGFLQRMNPGVPMKHERVCDLKDHEAIRSLVRDIAIGALIPHIGQDIDLSLRFQVHFSPWYLEPLRFD